MNGEREFIDGYRVGRYKVYCANRQVVLGDEKIDLPWRCFEAFLVLIEANGEIVDREGFYRRLWPDVVVEESNLNQAIARLRKQLGDSGAESIIETVPRRGYRLLVRPERLAGKGPVAPTHVESPSWFRRWRIPLIFALILLAAAVAVRFGWQRWERRRQALALVEEGFRLVAENRVSQVAEANTRFSRAVELDPGLALGYAGLAEAMVRSVDGSRIHAKEMAERSLRIEPACAECQAIAGFILMTYGWRFSDALRDFRAAALKEPNHAKIQRWHAQVLACSGKLEQALQQIDRAVSLQPTDAAAAAMRAGILYFMGRYEEAISAARLALGLRSGFTSANDWIYRPGLAAGRIEEALHAECVKLRSQLLPKSALGEAVNYTINMWAKLRRCLDHAEVELSNNVAENSMRPVALGRKNWLHVGSAKSGPKGAAVLSVGGACHPPRGPVQENLLAVPAGMDSKKLSEIASLTPARWSARA